MTTLSDSRRNRVRERKSSRLAHIFGRVLLYLFVNSI